MTLVPSTAASAVYHDALTTARSFRTLVFVVLLLALLGQLTLFFVAKYTDTLFPVGGTAATQTDAAVAPTNDAVVGETEAGVEVEARTAADTEAVGTGFNVPQLLNFLLFLTIFAGLICAILLPVVLAFTVLVMLNGRVVGVTRVTSAFFWSLVLGLLLLPWHWILGSPALAGSVFHVPGVLYMWADLERSLASGGEWAGYYAGGRQWLGWVRFVAWPVVALLVLLWVFVRSGKGIKEALGEDLPDDAPVDMTHNA